MRILAISSFDPASVILSHRDLMNAAGHDFRVAVVRAYTDRQRQADYVCEQLNVRDTHVRPGVVRREASIDPLMPNLDDLRAFAEKADVIQFHPGIGQGNGDWASKSGSGTFPIHEFMAVEERLKIADILSRRYRTVRRVAFFHGSVNTWTRMELYKTIFDAKPNAGATAWVRATSTLEYAVEFNAAYLPPLVSPPEVDGAPVLARLRGDDDPLVIAHTPTDRVACSTEVFLQAAQHAGAVTLLGEGKSHRDIWALKLQAHAGFDHLRGAFSTNTLENAAVGLVPLFRLGYGDHDLMRDRFVRECECAPIRNLTSGMIPAKVLQDLSADPAYCRELQQHAHQWWKHYFSAEPITNRLVKFYGSL